MLSRKLLMDTGSVLINNGYSGSSLDKVGG